LPQFESSLELDACSQEKPLVLEWMKNEIAARWHSDRETRAIYSHGEDFPCGFRRDYQPPANERRELDGLRLRDS